jgi:hypothetical protein
MGKAMALPSLLRLGSTTEERSAFTFEHANAHRNLLGAMSPLTRFSVLPYLLEPMTGSSAWRLNHQTAHNDALTTLPTFPWSFWIEASYTPPPGEEVPAPGYAPDVLPLGVGFNQNLIDIDMQNPNVENMQWWLFANHNEHLLAQAVLPEYLIFPFW